MHVLTITPFFPRFEDDPVAGFVSEPLRELGHLGVENSILAVAPFHKRPGRTQPTKPPAQWVRYPAIPGNWGLPVAGSFLFAFLIGRVRQMHRTNRIDVIHAHAALPCGHAASLLSRELRIPFVVAVHGLDAFFDRQAPGMPGRWCRRIASHVYRSARNVICVSERVREQVLAGCAACITSVIYNGVDSRLFSPAPGYDEASPTVLSVGNLIPVKGHEILLRAVAELRAGRPDISCKIIGTGPELTRLENLSRELRISDCVQFLGRKTRAEVAEAMRASTLFVLPSRYEGLGCVYLEAMACGKSVIGCRGQGIEEIVRHGRNGLLVGPDNVRELTEAIWLLLSDSDMRHRLGWAARDTITAGYTLADQAEQLSALYRESAR